MNNKKIFLIAASLLTIGLYSCGSNQNLVTTSEDSANNNETTSIITTNEENTSSNDQTTSNDSTTNKETTEETLTTTTTTNDDNTCGEITPDGNNPVGGGKRLSTPCNKNDKIVIGNSNETMSTFNFDNSLPDNFRYIFGNNFTKPEFYSDGSLKFSYYGPAKKGFQTPFFVSSQKLELRLRIGEMYNNSKGNDIDKDEPVIRIWAFDIDGNYLRESLIKNFDTSKKNNKIVTYLDGNDVSYLEVREFSMPHIGSQAYNFGLKGIDMIAWNYPL